MCLGVLYHSNVGSICLGFSAYGGDKFLHTSVFNSTVGAPNSLLKENDGHDTWHIDTQS